VVGWSMSAEMTAQFVTDALVMAIWRRGKPDALLHHSDRGSQSLLHRPHVALCAFSRRFFPGSFLFLRLLIPGQNCSQTDQRS
jgi:transposase InsO family protein